MIRNLGQHPKRYILDALVGSVLTCMLLGGSVYIYLLNNDARDLQFDSALAMQGQQFSNSEGCVACHTVDGSPGVGPTWLHMWGRTEKIGHGRTVEVDEEYVRESLLQPGAKLVENYPNVMPHYFLEEPEITALLAYIKALSCSEHSSLLPPTPAPCLHK